MIAFAACTSHDEPEFVRSPDAGSAPGYVSGAQVTLADGASVTLPNGSPVTTPEIRDADGNPITTAKGYTKPGSATGAPSTTQYVESTGPVSFEAPKDPPRLVFPVLGVYGFSETITPDDGGAKTTRSVHFNLTSPDQHAQVRWQESDAKGAATASNAYIETHADDGLWLVQSTLSESDKCDWAPRSPELPKATTVKVGASVTRESTCTATLNGEDVTFRLRATVRSLNYEDLLIGGTSYRCIKVARDRVLSFGSNEVITTAHEWYAFDLGIRVKVLDHTITRTDGQQRSQNRELVLSSKP